MRAADPPPRTCRTGRALTSLGPTARLLVVLGSTRPGRAGEAVACWFASRAAAHGDFDVEVADLAAVDLPMLDEPEHPRLGSYVHEHTRRWSRTVSDADAVALVTPEYNRSFPAPLKNALDYLHAEWRGKPVVMVSYGGTSGGMHAAQALKLVVHALGLVTVHAGVALTGIGSRIDADGHLRPDESTDRVADVALADLHKLHLALAPLRAAGDAVSSASTGNGGGHLARS